MESHVIIDGGTEDIVALAIDFVTATDETSCSSDLAQFKAKCNPEWMWSEEKMTTIFNQVMDIVNPPTPTVPKKNATSNNNSSSNP